jgi:hypothetical protein
MPIGGVQLWAAAGTAVDRMADTRRSTSAEGNQERGITGTCR